MVTLVATGNGTRIRGHEFEATKENAENLVRCGYASYKTAKVEATLDTEEKKIIVKPAPRKGRKPNKK